jgi:hypothetical protein
VFYVQYEVSEKNKPRANLFAEGAVYANEKGGKLAFRKALMDTRAENKFYD